MKNKLRRRLTALALCGVMIFSGSSSALADSPAGEIDETAIVQEQVEQIVEEVVEEADTEVTPEATEPVVEEVPEAEAPVEEAVVEEVVNEVAAEEPQAEIPADATEETAEVPEVETPVEEVAETTEPEAEALVEEVPVEEAPVVEVTPVVEVPEETPVVAEQPTIVEKVAEAVSTATEKVVEVVETVIKYIIGMHDDLTYEDDQVIIKVYAEEDEIIPEGTKIKVVPILADDEETKEKYEEVATSLQEKAGEDNQVVEGFLAYDITLVDPDGNEFEPYGEVKVTMEYKEAALPAEIENAEAAEVTIHHFEEDENGEVKEIVDMVKEEAIEATVEVTEAVEVETVEFKTESFSVFTITWSSYGSTWEVEADIVDVNGNTITLANDLSTSTLSSRTSFVFSTISKTGTNSKFYTITATDGKVYTFVKATVDGANGTQLYSIFRSNGRFYYKTGEYSSNTRLNNKSVYMVYQEVVQTPEQPVATGTLTFKKVNSNGTGLAGAKFMLYQSNGTTEIKSATSATDGTVTFTQLADGTYVVKETQAPAGYVKDKSSWTVTVTGGVAVMKNGEEQEVTEVTNYSEKEEAVKNLTTDKTAQQVINDKYSKEDRVYQIDISAVTSGQTDGQEAKGASIVLVLDASSSMNDDGKSLSDIKTAAKDFVNAINNVSKASEIAVIWYQGTQGESSNTTNVKGFYTLETNKASVDSAINSGSANGGTPMGDALNAAASKLNSAKYADKYVVFFTDGLPGYYDGNSSSYVAFNCMVANSAYSAANTIKQSAILYTVGYKLSGSVRWEPGHTGTSSNTGNHGSHNTTTTAANFLKNYIATQPASGSSEQYAFTVEDKTSLANQFASLAGKIGSLFEVQADKIVDVIDARFELTQESEEALKKAYGNNVTITRNEDGTTTIEWTGDAAKVGNSDAKDGAAGPWETTFLVKAKDDFIGGNMIPTNGIDSGVYVDEDTTKLFEHPSVNVHLSEIALQGGTYTIYKGDTLGIDDVSALVNSLGIVLEDEAGNTQVVDSDDLPVLTEEQITSLKAGTPVEAHYSYGTTEDVVGKFVYTYDSEKLELTVTYVADDVETREDNLPDVEQPDGEAVDEVSANAANTVSEIAGTIVIKKVVDEVANVNRTFTFAVVNGEEESKLVTVTVRAGETEGTSELLDLARGTYTVSEVLNTDYVVQSAEIGENTNSYNSKDEAGKTVSISLGYENATEKIDVIKGYTYKAEDGGTLGEVIFTNERATQDITVTKNWEDYNDEYKLRPESVTFTLYRKPITDPVTDWDSNPNVEEEVEQYTITETGNWTLTIESLPIKNADGIVYEYKVVEDPVAGYTTSYDATKPYEITNTLNETNINKVWVDAENAHGKRPKTLDIYLNDEEATLTFGTDKSGTVEILELHGKPVVAKFTSDWTATLYGVSSEFEISEASVNGYVSNKVVGTDGVTFTNTFNISIMKVSKTDKHVLEGAIFKITNGEDTYYAKSLDNGLLSGWYQSLQGDQLSQQVVDTDLNGTYVLSEVVAPAGYMVSGAKWNVQMANGLIIKVEGTDTPLVDLLDDNLEFKAYTMSFENEALYELPSTGGFGIYVPMTGGVIMMMAAAFILMNNRRREVLER